MINFTDEFKGGLSKRRFSIGNRRRVARRAIKHAHRNQHHQSRAIEEAGEAGHIDHHRGVTHHAGHQIVTLIGADLQAGLGVACQYRIGVEQEARFLGGAVGAQSIGGGGHQEIHPGVAVGQERWGVKELEGRGAIRGVQGLSGLHKARVVPQASAAGTNLPDRSPGCLGRKTEDQPFVQEGIGGLHRNR